ncbi:Imidazole glycerol phosphate synthaseamido transferase subunit [Salmonella enterica subsp. arizonae]|uniref:Imidazole glycerol phosphate synthase subunit HisH n=1 Tax=Salmonella enterica subsp. arizonae TaxID=59203 RepID=A0A379SUB6_SALER|nr:Imidazole glycerol phosphate synthaseamido transferase subunit [Salmonella enterica subsp. arizonae]
MIKIIDYGIGNIQAFLNVYKRLGISADVARSVDDIESATHLVLPGVGAFDQAMALFNDSGLREGIEKRVFEERIPIIGICVGMQMLATSSEEGKHVWFRLDSWSGSHIQQQYRFKKSSNATYGME